MEMPNEYYDRRWMYNPVDRAGRTNVHYLQGIEVFLWFASHELRGGKMKCPCEKCKNGKRHTPEMIAKHLRARGFVTEYEVWYEHGEQRPPDHYFASSSTGDAAGERILVEEENMMARMVIDSTGDEGEQSNYGDHEEPSNYDSPHAEEAPHPEAAKYLNILKDATVPLRDKSKKSVLQHVAQLMHAKVQHGISQRGFDAFMKLAVQGMDDEDAKKMPTTFKGMERYLKTLRLPEVEIHVCVNDCVIFYKEWADYDHCPYCNERRYKVNRNITGRQNIPRKKLWYFPIADRLKQLFLCPKTAKHMTWHAENKSNSDELIHPSQGEAWKHFQRCHPGFAAEDRNAYVAICTDGFNPSNNSGNHSIWPVFYTVYNLPPELCMTEPFSFMAMIISGPRSPGKNLDVMLQPLIHDLETLWSDGVLAYDSHRKANFILKAALMWTISDYPAYGMLSSWSTHGGLSCPYCMEDTSSHWLNAGKKWSFFDSHRKFLPQGHPFRQNKSGFVKDAVCDEIGVERRPGIDLIQRVAGIGTTTPGLHRGRPPPGFGETHNWVQQSIFWRLPYWYTHLVRHNLDVMHVEKNVFDNVFYTVLDDPVKTKDNLNARKDLQRLTKRRALYPRQDANGKPVKTKGTYTVSREQKREIFKWVHTLDFPDNYASQIYKCFNCQTGKVSNMKSHDCHIFLQRLMPIAFADYLPTPIWQTLAELSMFFRKLCSPKILASEMAILETSIVETLCKLEKIFPPSFFDSMEHLTMHLPYEAKVCGPVQYRWMYPFERRMHTLKQYVKNPALPEACIAKAYINYEVSHFCERYFQDDIEDRLNRMGRNEVPYPIYSDDTLSVFRNTGKPTGAGRQVKLTHSDVQAAHLYALLNCTEAEQFLSVFDLQVCPGLGSYETQQMRATHFPKWFKKVVTSDLMTSQVTPSLHCLAMGPTTSAKKYTGYIVNGFRFHIEEHRRGSSNSGVCVRGISGADADPSNYYGKLLRVYELDYHGYSVFFFRCKWFNTLSPAGVWSMPEYGLVEVNQHLELPVNEPFIMASQATQVYYTLSPGNSHRTISGRRGWHSIISTRARHVIQGFAITAEGPSDDEAEENNAPPREYQDDTVPPLNRLPHETIDEDIQLATGEYQILEDNDSGREGNSSSDNEDQALEHFSSDEYPDA